MRRKHQTFLCLVHDPMTLLLLGLIYGADGISQLALVLVLVSPASLC